MFQESTVDSIRKTFEKRRVIDDEFEEVKEDKSNDLVTIKKKDVSPLEQNSLQTVKQLAQQLFFNNDYCINGRQLNQLLSPQSAQTIQQLMSCQ